MKIDGGCFCGFLTYEAEIDPDRVNICHCLDCQIISGSAFRVSVPTRDHSFRLLSGAPTIFMKTGGSGAPRPQAFCPRCGTQIYSTSGDAAPRTHNIRVGTVRQRDILVPGSQAFCRSRRDWLDDLGTVPAFAGRPG
jgi:hypothetical protein